MAIQIKLAQHHRSGYIGVSPYSSTIPIQATTSGTSLIVCAQLSVASGDYQPASTLVFTTGAGWQKVTPVSHNNYPLLEIWVLPVCPPGTQEIGYTVTKSMNAQFWTYQILGISGESDVSAALSQPPASIYPVTGTTASTTTANQLVIGACATYDGTGYSGSTPLNGFTLRQTNQGLSEELFALDKIVSTTGPQSSGLTTTYQVTWCGVIATFKEGVSAAKSSMMMGSD